MAYTYDIETSKKDNLSTNCLTTCHILFNIINLFLSTFLVAHIYSLTTDIYEYILNVGLYQLSTYGTMLIAYFIFSFLVDKTNRVWIYRLGILLCAVLVIITIFYGKDLANIIALAGFCYGLALAAYYSSYNVLKQEMVSRKVMGKYAFLNKLLTKGVSVVCPFLLGMLIDVSTFSTIAIVVFAIALAQMVVSFFIKSQKPESSNFKIFEYIKKLKTNKPFKKKMAIIYIITAFYSFNTVLTMLLNVNIMMQFSSNFTLGTITSAITLTGLISLIIFNRFSKFGKRSWIYILGASLPFGGSLLFVLLPNFITLIIYDVLFVLSEILASTVYDAIRNKHLKEYGFYQDIAEHQCIVETIFQIIRIATFGLLIIVSLLKEYLVFQIAFVVFAFLMSGMSIFLLIYERKERTNEMIKNQQQENH